MAPDYIIIIKYIHGSHTVQCGNQWFCFLYHSAASGGVAKRMRKNNDYTRKSGKCLDEWQGARRNKRSDTINSSCRSSNIHGNSKNYISIETKENEYDILNKIALLLVLFFNNRRCTWTLYLNNLEMKLDIANWNFIQRFCSLNS